MEFFTATQTDWSSDVFEGASGAEAVTTVTSLGTVGAALTDVTPAGYPAEVGEPPGQEPSDPVFPAEARQVAPASGRRQRGAVVILVAMLAAIGYLVHSSESVARSNNTVTQNDRTVVSRELASANSFLHEHGVLTGWPRPPGVLVASTMGELVLARRVDGVCYYGGLLPGTTASVHIDSSGTSCTRAAIASVQQALNSYQAEEITQAALSLHAAGQEAQLLAAGYAGGVTSPVFGTQPESSVPGVTTIVVTPNSMTLQDSIGTGGCLTLVVPVVGTMPTPQPGPCAS
jgi:hypothetical protein